MARICEICGKGVRSGNKIIRRGMAKKKGGIGLHITGVTKRSFLPNLQKVRVVSGGGVSRMMVCAACIKSDRVVKA